MSRYFARTGFVPVYFLFALFFLCACASDAEKTEKFLSEGQEFLEKGDYSNAVIQLKNAIEIDPGSGPAWELLARVHLQQGDAQQGFSSLLRLEQIRPDDLDNIIQVASFFLLAQQIEEAENRVNQVLAIQPDHIPALFLLAGILSRDPENLDRIAGIYEKILTLDDRQTRAYLALARIYAARSQYPAAKNSLEHARSLEPDNVQIYRTLFDFYLSQNDVPAAEAVYDELMTRKPDDPEPHIFLGSFHLARQSLDKAETRFLTALEKAPQNLSAHMFLADLYNRQTRTDEAKTYIQKAMDLAPDNHEILNRCAEFYFSHKEIVRAQEIVDRILDQRPGYLPARTLKGRILAENNELEAAEEIFRKLIQDDSDSGQNYYLLGSVLEKKGETARAQSFLSTAIEKNPGLFQARLILGNIYFSQGDLALAEASARQVLAQVPDNYPAGILLGNVQMAFGNIPAARTLFDRLGDAVPENPTAYFRLGILERSENNYDLAISHLNQALAIDPDLMDVFSALISVYALQKNHDQALALCDTHLADRGKNPMVAAVVLNLKANIYLADNQLEKAVATYEESIQKNPGYVTPYLSLAKIYTAQNRIDDAIETYTALIENRPDQAPAFTLAGTLYEKKGRYDLARTHYETALKIDPDLIPALNNLAYLLAEQDTDLDLALDLARQARRQAGQIPAVMDTLGWVYFKKALYDSAAMEFEAAAGIDPSNPIFFYHLGLTFHELGRSEEARTNLETALKLQPDFKGADTARKILGTL